MKYEELKELVFGYLHYHSSDSCKKQIDLYFQRYEKESPFVFGDGTKEIKNQASDTGDVILKRRTQDEMNTHILMTIENNRQYHSKKIESMQKEIEALKAKKVDSETKQERFEIINWSDKKFDIVDRKGIIKLKCVYDSDQAIDICNALNEMEGGGK